MTSSAVVRVDTNLATCHEASDGDECPAYITVPVHIEFDIGGERMRIDADAQLEENVAKLGIRRHALGEHTTLGKAPRGLKYAVTAWIGLWSAGVAGTIVHVDATGSRHVPHPAIHFEFGTHPNPPHYR